MKNFIKQLLAVIFGNAIFFGLLFFTLFFVGLMMALSSDRSAVGIKSNSILKLEIPSSFTELPPIEDEVDWNDEGTAVNIFDYVQSIKDAAKNNSIKALVLPLNTNLNPSYQQLDLVRNAILEFKKSGKPTYAYGEVVSQKMYYLATACDRIYLNPNGYMDLRGLGAEVQFLKGTLDKLEIQPQIFYAGKFKSATEPLRLTQMSEESKLQTKEFLQDFAQIVYQKIADARKITVAQLNEDMNQLKGEAAEDALLSHLIDGKYYWDEVEKVIAGDCKLAKDKKLNYCPMTQYMEREYDRNTSGDVAVYVAEGEIVDGEGDESSVGSHKVAKELRALADNKSVKAVVLRVNSPGGSVIASGVILRELQLLQAKKPVIVSMGSVAASGGYYISSFGSKIFAEPMTITGSIGVFSIVPNIGGLMKDKLGITFDEVELNDHSVMGITKPLEAVEAAKFQKSTDDMYRSFKSIVAASRKMTMDQVETLAQGRVWSGTKAKANGLIDQLGTLDDAVKEASLKAKCDNEYYIANKMPNYFELILRGRTSALFDQIVENYTKEKLGAQYQNFKTLEKYSKYSGAQAKMPYTLEIY